MFSSAFAALFLATAAPAPLMTVRIAPGPMDERVGSGAVDIRIHVPDVEAPANAPLTDFAPGNLVVIDRRGVVPRAPGEGRGWSPAREVKGDLTLSYRLDVRNTPTNSNTTPLNPRIDGKGFSAIGTTMLAIPKVPGARRILIDWDLSAMGKGATAVSSFGDGDVEVAAGPVARLSRAVFMAGRLSRSPRKATGKFSAAWSGDPGYDLRPPMAWSEKLHAHMVGFFRTPDDPAYRVFLRRSENNPGGGVAFPNSFFETYGPGVTAESMKGVLGHEMVHTFVMGDMGRWYSEGAAVYYQLQLPWRAGMVTTEQYLRDINLTAARYYTNAEIGSHEDRIGPNFFRNPWLNTLAYDRGAIYFAALDGKVRRASGGKRSIDDLVRIMVGRQRAGASLQEADWTDLLRKEIGEDAVALHRGMIDGSAVMVPESGDYGPCFRRVDTKIRRYALGFQEKRLGGDMVEVTNLGADSEAAKAGVREGDLVTITPRLSSEGPRRDPAQHVTLTGTRDGKPISITYNPRGAAVDGYQWERVPNVPETACRSAFDRAPKS